MTPALAIIDALPKEARIFFIGRKHPLEGDKALSLEYQTITDMGITFFPLTTGRLQRKISTRSFISLVKIPYGFFQALSILISCKPDVIIGFGGYLAVPVGLAAWILRIPFVIHEQTLDAGLANKFLARFAKKIK